MQHFAFSRWVEGLRNLFIILVLAGVAWYLLHRTPNVPPDLYSYLHSLAPEMVVQAQKEGEGLGKDGWATLIAIRSTIPEAETELSAQLKKGRAFADLNWSGIQPEKAKLVKYRRELLIKYPYYMPNRFTFPVLGKYWYEDTFGAGREGGKRKHEGTDIFGREGTLVLSVSAGRIEQLGWNRLGGERVGIRGYDGNYYYYAHLQMIAPELQKGMRIAKGQVIGTMGHTGDALTTPDHLHFGIELANGTWINPYPLLKVWEQQSR